MVVVGVFLRICDGLIVLWIVLFPINNAIMSLVCKPSSIMKAVHCAILIFLAPLPLSYASILAGLATPPVHTPDKNENSLGEDSERLLRAYSILQLFTAIYITILFCVWFRSMSNRKVPLAVRTSPLQHPSGFMLMYLVA